MIKTSFLPSVCFLLLTAAAFAQPTLQGNVVPNVGDFASFATADSNAIQPGNPGANLNWNFSNLQPQSPPTPYTYISPAGTPYAGNYPTATLVTKVGGADTAVYSYSRKEGSQFLILGTASNTFTQIYSDPDAQLKYPTNYNGTYTDTYAYVTDAGSGFPFYSTGTHTVKFDAYGTLTTPLGVFPNAMRIKAVTVQTDSSAFFGNEIINHDEMTTYDWLVANQPGSLVTINYSKTITETRIPGIDTLISISPVTKSVNYITTGSVRVAERPNALSGISDLSVGPNPATDQLNLHFSAAAGGPTLEVHLLDATGRIVLSRQLSLNAGPNTAIFPVADLPRGAYFLQLSDGGNGRILPWQKF